MLRLMPVWIAPSFSTMPWATAKAVPSNSVAALPPVSDRIASATSLAQLDAFAWAITLARPVELVHRSASPPVLRTLPDRDIDLVGLHHEGVRIDRGDRDRGAREIVGMGRQRVVILGEYDRAGAHLRGHADQEIEVAERIDMGVRPDVDLVVGTNVDIAVGMDRGDRAVGVGVDLRGQGGVAIDRDLDRADVVARGSHRCRG